MDHPKVNDTYGHATGDMVLNAAANLLQTQVRTSDCVGRYGGEEFLVILPHTPLPGATEVFQRILEACCQAPYDVSQDQHISVTASIGIATHSREYPFPNVGALVNAADQALYAAKGKCRNMYVTFADHQDHYQTQAQQGLK